MDTIAPRMPCAPEIELNILARAFKDQAVATEIVSTLSADDFYTPTLCVVFKAMQKLTDEADTLDEIGLISQIMLTTKGSMEDARKAISPVVTASLTAAHGSIATFIETLRKKTKHRKQFEYASKLAQAAFAEDDAAADQAILSLSDMNDKEVREPRHVKEGMADVMIKVDRIMQDGVAPGIQTGLVMVDQTFGGFFRGDLIIMAGRPGMGKTSVLIQLAQNIGKANTVFIASLEMSEQELIQRALASEASVDVAKFRNGGFVEADVPVLMEGANGVSNRKLYIGDSPTVTCADIFRQAKRIKKKNGLDVLFVDYLQLIEEAEGENRQQQVSAIARKLKKMARTLDIAVVALCQLSRSVEGRADKRPMLSDLRESGAIEQEADLVLFLYREDYYDADSDLPNILELIGAKYRHGPTGTVTVYYNKALMQIRNLEIERTYLAPRDEQNEDTQ